MRRLLAIATLAGMLLTPSVHAEKVLRYAFQSAETSFDPVRTTDLYSHFVVANIFRSPLRYGWLSAGQVEPNTLTALPEVSADFKTFTFHVRPQIFYAPDPAFNGKKRELVAEDYVFSFKRIYDPHWKSQYYGGLETLKIDSLEKLRDDAQKSGKFDYDTVVPGIRTLDRYTFQIQLGVPTPRFAEDNLIEQVVETAREVADKYGDAIGEHPVGTGPYMISSWVRSSKIILVRNPNYGPEIYEAHPKPDDAEGQAIAARFNGRAMPFIDRVEISIIEESQPRWLAFANHEHDVMSWMPLDLAPLAIPNNRLAPTLDRQHVKFWRIPSLQVSPVIFNMENPVVGGYTPEKVALRRAIGLGIDAPAIVGQVFKYQGLLAEGPILPGQYGYDPAMRTEMGDYDPARANAILDTYGYLPRHGDKWRDLPDGSPLTIEYLTEPDQYSRNIDEILKRSMDALGIRFNVNPAKWPDQYKKAQAGNYMMWFLGQSASTLNPSGGFLNQYGPAKGGENLTRFDMPVYDAMFRQSEELPNGDERLAVLKKMVDLLLVYEPDKYVYHPIRTYMAYPWVEGYRPDLLILGWWQYVDVDEQQQKAYL